MEHHHVVETGILWKFWGIIAGSGSIFYCTGFYFASRGVRQMIFRRDYHPLGDSQLAADPVGKKASFWGGCPLPGKCARMWVYGCLMFLLLKTICSLGWARCNYYPSPSLIIRLTRKLGSSTNLICAWKEPGARSGSLMRFFWIGVAENDLQGHWHHCLIKPCHIYHSYSGNMF